MTKIYFTAENKNCVVCGKKYHKMNCVSRKQWQKSRFCSRKCAGVYGISNITEEGKRRGYEKLRTPEARKRMSELKKKQGIVDDKHPQWKGDNASYEAIHIWVARRKGRPKYCQDCGKYEPNSRKIHWANVSGQYKRDLNDYIRLCYECHRKRDGLGRGINTKTKKGKGVKIKRFG